MEPNNTLTSYFTQVEHLTVELNGNPAYAIGQGNMLGVLLWGLRPKYHTIQTVLQTNDKLKLEDAKLKLHVFKANNLDAHNTDNALLYVHHQQNWWAPQAQD